MSFEIYPLLDFSFILVFKFYTFHRALHVSRFINFCERFKLRVIGSLRYGAVARGKIVAATAARKAQRRCGAAIVVKSRSRDQDVCTIKMAVARRRLLSRLRNRYATGRFNDRYPAYKILKKLWPGGI